MSENQAELEMYHALVQAALDYALLQENFVFEEYNKHHHFQQLKKTCESYFTKGQVSKLKRTFRDLTEPHLEMVNLSFDTYLRANTGYEFSIFEKLFAEIETLITKGKISTEGQYYNAQIMIDKLIHETPQDEKKIAKLELMMEEFADREVKKQRRKKGIS